MTFDIRSVPLGSRHDLAQCPDCLAWRSARNMNQHRTANHLWKMTALKRGGSTNAETDASASTKSGGANEIPAPPDYPSQRRDVTIAKVLSRLAEGARREEIARDLGCTLKTVNRRIEYFMMSCGAKTREQMMAEAVRMGVLK